MANSASGTRLCLRFLRRKSPGLLGASSTTDGAASITVKSAVVEAGNMAKFGQDPSLRRKLMASGDRLICEAASSDRVWGIGYAAHRAMPMRKHWGENRLGKALMTVRERLKREEEEAKEPWER